MFYVWLGIIVLLIIVELMTYELTTMWFVISGIVALILNSIYDDFMLEFITFIVLGIILLVTFKGYLYNYLDIRRRNKLANMTGIVIEKITKKENGKIKIKRKVYEASSDKSIKTGSCVEIINICDNIVEVRVINDTK